MEIKFLGTGGAFDYQYGTSSATVQTHSHLFLIDCGTSVFQSLMEHNLIEKIDFLVLTHLHGDHVGCLFQYILFNGKSENRKVTILYPDEVFKNNVQQLLDLQFVDQKRYEFVPIESVPTIGFLDTTGQHIEGMLNYAYYFSEDDELIYYSGDIGKIETAVDFLQTRTEKNIRVFHDALHVTYPSHVFYKDINEKLKDYETYLYHCSQEKIPADNTTPLVVTIPELNWN